MHNLPLTLGGQPTGALIAATGAYLALQGAGLWQFARSPSGHWPRLALAYGTYAAGCAFCCLSIIGWLTVAGL